MLLGMTLSMDGLARNIGVQGYFLVPFLIFRQKDCICIGKGTSGQFMSTW